MADDSQKNEQEAFRAVRELRVAAYPSDCGL